jgi:hypothetical protein
MKILSLILLLLTTFNLKSQVSFKYIEGEFYTVFKDKNIRGPQIINNLETIKNVIGNKLIYPRFAKEKLIEYSSFINIKVDITGTLKQSNIYYDEKSFCDKLPMFDTLSQNYISLLDKKFICGEIDSLEYIIPIRYTYKFDTIVKKVFFYISIINNKILVDSSETYPPILKENSFLYRKNLLMTYESNDLNEGYGTTRIGINLDTLGNPIDTFIILTNSKELEEKAKTKLWFYNFFPAHENGKAIPSYVEIDFKSDMAEYYDAERTQFRYMKSSKYIQNANKYFNRKDFKNALEHYLVAEKYYVDDYDLLMNKALCQLNLEMYFEACETLEYIKRIAIKKPYPLCVSEVKINELIKSFCK